MGRAAVDVLGVVMVSAEGAELHEDVRLAFELAVLLAVVFPGCCQAEGLGEGGCCEGWEDRSTGAGCGGWAHWR